MVVAINKIDSTSDDIESVLLELASLGVVSEELGGDVPCVPISAKDRINLEVLEDKLFETLKLKVDLLSDFSSKATCFVVESRFETDTNQFTATVLVKSGTLHLEDVIVCGPDIGRVRFMTNDQFQHVSHAHPGQAVRVGGFKHIAEVGHPLYAVNNHAEA